MGNGYCHCKLSQHCNSESFASCSQPYLKGDWWVVMGLVKSVFSSSDYSWPFPEEKGRGVVALWDVCRNTSQKTHVFMAKIL